MIEFMSVRGDRVAVNPEAVLWVEEVNGDFTRIIMSQRVLVEVLGTYEDTLAALRGT